MTYLGIAPYLHYEEADAMLAWLETVLGFEETARWVDDEGHVSEAEMRLDGHELWIAGHHPGYWQERGRPPEQLTLLWVDDVDAVHRRVVAAGVEVAAPTDKPYLVRSFTVTDPQGYGWDVMQRLEAVDVPDDTGLTRVDR